MSEILCLIFGIFIGCIFMACLLSCVKSTTIRELKEEISELRAKLDDE